MAIQRGVRAERAKWLAKQLHQRLDLDGIEKTMVIVPSCVNLKKRKWRRSFGFLASLQGRIYTDRLLQSTLRRFVKMLPFQLNFDPKFKSLGEFLAAQAQLLRKVARQAKRMGKVTQASVTKNKCIMFIDQLSLTK